MIERFNPRDLSKKFIERHGGRITLRSDHGSKNSNGRTVERTGKKPKLYFQPDAVEIRQGLEEYFSV